MYYETGIFGIVISVKKKVKSSHQIIDPLLKVAILVTYFVLLGLAQ